MADEVAASAGKAVGKATAKAFMSPSIAVVKLIPQGIIELALRGSAVALGLCAFISGAACQGSISALRVSIPGVGSPTFSAAGWVIFLSFWVMVYQGLAIVQLFLHVKLLYVNVPYINWSVFFLVDIIAIGIGAGGYFCGAVSMAAYASSWVDISSSVQSSAGATSAFSFFSLFLLIGMIVYFLLAKYVLLWPSHGDEPPAGGRGAAGSKADDYAPDDE